MRRSKRQIKRGRKPGDGMQPILASNVEATLAAEDQKREWKESLSPRDRSAYERVEGLPPSVILEMVKADILDRRDSPYFTKAERMDLCRSAMLIAKEEGKPGVLVQIERLLRDQEDSDAKMLIELSKLAQSEQAGNNPSVSTHLHLHLNGLDGDDLAEHVSRTRRAAHEIIQLDGAPGTRLVDPEPSEDPDQGREADPLPVQLDPEDPLQEGG